MSILNLTQRYGRFAKVLAATTAFVAGPLQAGGYVDPMMQRIEALENELRRLAGEVGELRGDHDALDAHVGPRAVVNAFDAMDMDMGGFFHTNFTHVDGDDGSATSFDRTYFNLFFDVSFYEDWTGFAEVSFHRIASDGDPFVGNDNDDPDFGPYTEDAEMVIAWFNYRYEDWANLQVGRMYTPHGVVNQEHFTHTLYASERPMLARVDYNGDELYPLYVDGAQIHGTHNLAEGHDIGYNMYIGNLTRSGVNGGTELGNEDDFYEGARIHYMNAEWGTTFGLNIFGGDRFSTEAHAAAGGEDADFWGWGADLHVDKGQFSLKAEYFMTDEDIDDDERVAGYIQPAWRFDPQWLVFYRFDYLDLDDNTDDDENMEHVIGVNYLPHPNVRFRADYTFKEFEEDDGAGTNDDDDADIFRLSASVNF